MKAKAVQATTVRDLGLLMVTGFLLFSGVILSLVGSAAAQTAPSITGLSVAESSTTETTATVSWTVSPASTGQVEFGETPAFGRLFRNIIAIEETEVVSSSHAIWLFELNPGTTYYYRVRSTAGGVTAVSDIRTFTTKTPPAPVVVAEPEPEPEPEPVVEEETVETVAVSEPEPEEVVEEVSAEPEPEPEPIEQPETIAVPEEEIVEEPVEAPEPEEVSVAAVSVPEEDAEEASAVLFMHSDTETASEESEQGIEVGLHVFGEREEGQPAISPELEDDIQEFMGTLEEDPRGATMGGMMGTVDVRDYADRLCEENFIDPGACATWLVGEFADNSCREVGIMTKGACEAFLMERNDGVFPGCKTLDPTECDEHKALATIDLLQDDVFEDIDRIIAQAGKEQVLIALPHLTSIKPEHLGQARWWGSPRAEGQQTALGMVVLDADLDGLPDDYERSIGTDPLLADTDKDGTDDIIELQEGENPLGKGELGRDLTASEKTVVFRRPLEQPVAKPTADAGMTLKVNGSADGLNGTCEAGQTCILYLYSYVPMVLTTTADASGNWQYDLSDAMTDGHHTVYVAVTDDTGRIVKRSNPLSFFVNEAKAVTFDEFVAASAEPMGAFAQGTPEQVFAKYAVGAGLLVLIAILLAVAVLRKRPAVTGME